VQIACGYSNQQVVPCNERKSVLCQCFDDRERTTMLA